MASTFARRFVAALPLASVIFFLPASSDAFAGDVPSSTSSAEASFLSENDTAMSTMMTNMAVKPSGDIDNDFVAMMVPHHQGAIDMARAELQYGKNEQLRRIAQEIVVVQHQEIVAMHLAIGSSVSTSAPGTADGQNQASDPAHEKNQHPTHKSMSMKMNQEPQ
jgi:Neuraminidase (sialidase)